MDPLKQCNVKLVVNLALTILAMFVAVASCADVAAGGEVQGVIRVFNLVGADPVTMSDCRDFAGRHLPAGVITIAPMKEIEWRFRGYQTYNHDWTCRFQWTDSSDCGGATGGQCRTHSRVVRLWQSVCRDCVWRTHREGFYRRDGRVQPANWQFMFGWE